MPEPPEPKEVNPNRYAEIRGVSKEECLDRWKGVEWTSFQDGSEKGICQSDYDFDGWAQQHEGSEEDE